ncbi:MAG: deoxyribodipyrimidine photo-lyase [Neisseriaceae bacterium]|nr:deoxyribodipyrimidine photo-lyase [Neisseriaceae bacterium]
MQQCVWFRTDLRVTDHAALTAAMAAGPTLALYVVSPKQWQAHQDADCKVDFWRRQLMALQVSLTELNVPLRILQVAKWQDLGPQLADFCRQHQVGQLHYQQEYGLNEQRRDQAVNAALAKQGVQCLVQQDKGLLLPGSVLNQSGAPFKVFTAFKRVALQRLADQPPPVLPVPSPQPPLALAGDEVALGFAGLAQPPVALQRLWPAGEAAAQARLNAFVGAAIHDYAQARDIPSLPGTSQLSPYLAAGVLSVRQCLWRALAENEGRLGGGSVGVQTWVNELLWREFYQHILAAHPRLSMGQPFKAHTQSLPWRQAPDDLAKWQQGRTGIPLIDAAMRQLQHTGWMHNRLRMVCAMFLSKNLLIDWRLGESWFMRHLIDGDLAANNGGWQWCASTGTDAVPYFRIFNPMTQSQRFDPDGAFIKHWLPELAGLDRRRIHFGVGEQDALSAVYPAPMVDLKASRERALQAFKNCSVSG